MRVDPITSPDDIERAVKQAGTDRTARWYVDRIARALGVANLLPDDWAVEENKNAVFRGDLEPEPEQPEVNPELEKVVNAAGQAVDDVISDEIDFTDALPLVASIGAYADNAGVYDELVSGFETHIDQYVQAERLEPEVGDSLVAAIRRVRTDEGARRFKVPKGAVIITHDDKSSGPIARLKPQSADEAMDKLQNAPVAKYGPKSAARVKPQSASEAMDKLQNRVINGKGAGFNGLPAGSKESSDAFKQHQKDKWKLENAAGEARAKMNAPRKPVTKKQRNADPWFDSLTPEQQKSYLAFSNDDSPEPPEPKPAPRKQAKKISAPSYKGAQNRDAARLADRERALADRRKQGDVGASGHEMIGKTVQTTDGDLIKVKRYDADKDEIYAENPDSDPDYYGNKEELGPYGKSEWRVPPRGGDVGAGPADGKPTKSRTPGRPNRFYGDATLGDVEPGDEVHIPSSESKQARGIVTEVVEDLKNDSPGVMVMPLDPDGYPRWAYLSQITTVTPQKPDQTDNAVKMAKVREDAYHAKQEKIQSDAENRRIAAMSDDELAKHAANRGMPNRQKAAQAEIDKRKTAATHAATPATKKTFDPTTKTDSELQHELDLLSQLGVPSTDEAFDKVFDRVKAIHAEQDKRSGTTRHVGRKVSVSPEKLTDAAIAETLGYPDLNPLRKKALEDEQAKRKASRAKGDLAPSSTVDSNGSPIAPAGKTRIQRQVEESQNHVESLTDKQIISQINSIPNKIRSKQNQLGIAAESRRAKKQLQQSQREIKLRQDISDLSLMQNALKREQEKRVTPTAASPTTHSWREIDGTDAVGTLKVGDKLSDSVFASNAPKEIVKIDDSNPNVRRITVRNSDRTTGQINLNQDTSGKGDRRPGDPWSPPAPSATKLKWAPTYTGNDTSRVNAGSHSLVVQQAQGGQYEWYAQDNKTFNQVKTGTAPSKEAARSAAENWLNTKSTVPAATPPAATPSAEGFTSGKQTTYGTVNAKLKAGEPGHDTPQTSFADGTKPAVGNKVTGADGRTGTVVKTFQAYTAVKWDDTGRSKTVNNNTLNSGGGSAAPAANPLNKNRPLTPKAAEKIAAKKGEDSAAKDLESALAAPAAPTLSVDDVKKTLDPLTNEMDRLKADSKQKIQTRKDEAAAAKEKIGNLMDEYKLHRYDADRSKANAAYAAAGVVANEEKAKEKAHEQELADNKAKIGDLVDEHARQRKQLADRIESPAAKAVPAAPSNGLTDEELDAQFTAAEKSITRLRKPEKKAEAIATHDTLRKEKFARAQQDFSSKGTDALKAMLAHEQSSKNPDQTLLDDLMGELLSRTVVKRKPGGGKGKA